MSVKSEVLSYLSKEYGCNTLTTDQMQNKFGAKNPSAVINELRNDGYSVYLNTRKTSSGGKVSYYRLGTPRKSVIAAGILALRQSGKSTFA